MICPFECMNDGICVMFMKRHMCNCKTGYTGDACQVSYPVNPWKSITMAHDPTWSNQTSLNFARTSSFLTLIAKFLGKFWDRFIGKLIQTKCYISYMVSVKKIRMDEFSSRTASVPPQNWNLGKNWMTFPVKRPAWRPRKWKFQKNFWMSFPWFANKG